MSTTKNLFHLNPHQSPRNFVLGHIASEEPGSEFMAGWLKEKIPGIKTTHILSNNSLSFL